MGSGPGVMGTGWDSGAVLKGEDAPLQPVSTIIARTSSNRLRISIGALQSGLVLPVARRGRGGRVRTVCLGLPLGPIVTHRWLARPEPHVANARPGRFP